MICFACLEFYEITDSSEVTSSSLFICSIEQTHAIKMDKKFNPMSDGNSRPLEIASTIFGPSRPAISMIQNSEARNIKKKKAFENLTAMDFDTLTESLRQYLAANGIGNVITKATTVIAAAMPHSPLQKPIITPFIITAINQMRRAVRIIFPIIISQQFY